MLIQHALPYNYYYSSTTNKSLHVRMYIYMYIIHVYVQKSLYLVHVELAHTYKKLNNFGQERGTCMGTGLALFYSTH